MYLLDSNVISDVLRKREIVRDTLSLTLENGQSVILCQPVHFEVTRGLIHAKASAQLHVLETVIRPELLWVSLIDADWEQAARLWADATSRGRQFSDVDILLAAVAARLDAVLVSADADFDALPIKREDWRKD
jgi:predicted nucleic acid-binding protein